MIYFLITLGVVWYILVGGAIAKFGLQLNRIHSFPVVILTIFIWPIIATVEAFTE